MAVEISSALLYLAIFLIAAIWIKAGVVSPALLSMTVMVVILTSLITPPLVKLAFKGMPPEKK